MFEIGAVLREGWEKFKGNAGTLIGSTFIFIVIPVVVSFALAIVLGIVASQVKSQIVALLFNVVMQLVNFVLQQFLLMGLLKICLKVTRGEPASVGDLFSQGNKLLPGVIAMLLVTLGVLVGTILLIVPGIIFAIMTCLTLFFVVDRDLDPIPAIQASIAATKGSRLTLFGFGLLVFVISLILIPLTCGFGLFVLVPVIYLAMTRVYMQLSEAAAKEMA